MKASSIILAKLFEHIELKMIFELCLKLKRIMLGFFDTLQKFFASDLNETVLKNYVTSVQSQTDDRARPDKNGRGADWL